MHGGTARTTTVVVGDTQPIRRQAVVELMRRERGVGDVVACTTADEVASAGDRLDPAAVLVAPPLCPCPATLRELVGRLEPAHVVVYPAEAHEREALRDLVVLTGDASALELVRHVRIAVNADEGHSPSLTTTERAVLALFMRDRPLKTLSAESGMGYGTIKTHQRSIFRKLGVHSRPAAIERGIALGLIETLSGNAIVPLGFLGDWFEALTSLVG